MAKPVKPSAKKSLFNSDNSDFYHHKHTPQKLCSSRLKSRPRLGRRPTMGPNINASTVSLQFNGFKSPANQKCIGWSAGPGKLRTRLQHASLETNPTCQSLFVLKPDFKQEQTLKNQVLQPKESDDDSKVLGETNYKSAINGNLLEEVSSTDSSSDNQLKNPVSFALSIKSTQEAIENVNMVQKAGETKLEEIENNKWEQLNVLYGSLLEKMNRYEKKMIEAQSLWVEINEIKKKIETHTKGNLKDSLLLSPPSPLKRSCLKSGKRQLTESVKFNNDIVKSFTAPRTPSVRSKLGHTKSVGYTPKSLKKVLDHQSSQLFD